MRCTALGEGIGVGRAVEAAKREEARGAVIVVLASRPLGSERADDVGLRVADHLDHVRGHPLRRRLTERAIRPLEDPPVGEPDDVGRGVPLLCPLPRQLLGRPGTFVSAEPEPGVASRQREQRGRVPFVLELHRCACDPERLVIWMGVDEEDGRHACHANFIA